MAIELRVDGYFKMTIKYVNGMKIAVKDKDLEQGILDSLQMGEYVISMDKKAIYDINDLTTPIYYFELDTTDALEYEFEKDEDDEDEEEEI